MAMQPPPGSGQPSVGGFTINPPSVLIFGNPQLYDIAALAKLGQCSTTPSTTMGAVFIEVRDAHIRQTTQTLGMGTAECPAPGWIHIHHLSGVAADMARPAQLSPALAGVRACGRARIRLSTCWTLVLV